MDSDSPAASRTAGWTIAIAGALFTAIAGTFKAEFGCRFDATPAPPVSSGVRSHRHPAGGYGP